MGFVIIIILAWWYVILFFCKTILWPFYKMYLLAKWAVKDWDWWLNLIEKWMDNYYEYE